jgi:homocysteine S-methyltransferase
MMFQSDLLEPFFERQGFVMLDGALATELEKHGADLNHELWSARILIEAPEMIRQVSQDYLEAGADIITTATYQASIEGFKKVGVSRVHAGNLMRLSVDLAVLAREAFWSSLDNRRGRLRPLVAASIGPYGACLSDGGEYHGNYGLDKETLIKFHRSRMDVLAHSDADLLAFETIPSKLEAEALIELLEEYPQCSAWLSFSCKDEQLVCHGESFADCAALADTSEQIVAVGINCTSPKYLVPLLESAQAISTPLLAYPNRGEKWVAEKNCWSGTPVESQSVTAWYDAGARVIGGCCRTTPKDIARMKADLFSHLN